MKRIVITGGATREPIDSVRFISNVSSGQTSFELARFFHRHGFEVCLLLSEASPFSSAEFKIKRFSSTSSLKELLQSELKEETFAVFMAAAVSDYRVAQISTPSGSYAASENLPKLSSQLEVRLELVRNEKIIAQLKKWTQARIIGFKLTDSQDKEFCRKAVKSVFDAGADAVLQNDLSNLKDGLNRRFELYKSPTESKLCLGWDSLCQELLSLLK